MHLFYELLQVAIGHRDVLSNTPTESEWLEIFQMSQKQAVSGVAFLAIDKLYMHGQKLHSELLFEWIGLAEQIKKENKSLNKRCSEIVSFFADAGFRSCILKGQGNSMMYPDPLSRQPGDIDIWLDGTKEQIVSFVKKQIPNAEIGRHHADYPIFKDVDVEVHFHPTYTFVRRHTERLSKFIEERKNSQFDNPICLPGIDIPINVPTGDFNVVLQLSHMERHFFYGGLGLRHVIDFYYLLITVYKSLDKNEIKQLLSKLGLFYFAQAIVWILLDVLQMDKAYCLVEPDMKRGQLLLSEIDKTGNFGQYDSRWYAELTPYSRSLSVIARNLRMVGLFPEESISAPLDKIVYRYFKR